MAQDGKDDLMCNDLMPSVNVATGQVKIGLGQLNNSHMDSVTSSCSILQYESDLIRIPLKEHVS